MTYVETRMNVWEAVAGRAPGVPFGPADHDLWTAVVDRLNPARARPVLREGVEAVELDSVRGPAYVMVRSPDNGARACYLRLTPEEWQLALMMDGSLTVARLVAEFARIAGRLAPDQVRRVVADLAGNRMLEELPVDAFKPLQEIVRRPLGTRMREGLTATLRGRRMLVTNIDGFVSFLYRAGGKLLFTKVVAVLLALVSAVGLGVFGWTWATGTHPLFLTNGSYLLGALILLGLNALALALHELGHALATKHAGRRVPQAGLLIYFGIPSVFVDTTDVWMAGRRARILVTAAGPITGLVLAGSMQLVGLFVPAVAGLAFKLAFAWYVNVLFNLNPFIALDGYYLLMDWLEIPNLRGRGIAWVTGRLRRRSPRWSALDREGKIIGLYGWLAILWLIVALNIAYRIWADRVEGVVTGLWHNGATSRLLLIGIVFVLCLPFLHMGLGRLARWWRRSRVRSGERKREIDLPRRLQALRNSDLAALPEPALAGLAARARWLHPKTGTQLVMAGGPQTAIYVVVDGAMQARRPGDPGGTVRHHVGRGGVVGLGNALTGRSTTLNWHTAGTTLLAVPTATVAGVIGPLPGPPPADRAEAESLFADTPALSALDGDDRLSLISQAYPVDLEPGSPVQLPGPTHAVVVESGVIAMQDGTELRRGTLIGPVGDGYPGTVAQARTPTRLWVVPDASDLPPLLGPADGIRLNRPDVHVHSSPEEGIHPGDEYPPLVVPPAPPDGSENPDVDRRFERRMWWLVLLILLLAMLITTANVAPGPAWAEMPINRAMLTADNGRLVATIDGKEVVLQQGDKRYVEAGSKIEVRDGGIGRLTFAGGSATLLCGGSTVQVGELVTGGTAPVGSIVLENGRVLADTGSTSTAYKPLALTVSRPLGNVVSLGKAWYSVDPANVTVSSGRVEVSGSQASTTPSGLSCGDGVPIQPPASESPSEDPTSVPPVIESPSVPPTTEPAAEDPVRPDPIPQPGGNNNGNPQNDDPPAEEGTTTPPRTSASPSSSSPKPPPAEPPPVQSSPPPPADPPDEPLPPPVIINPENPPRPPVIIHPPDGPAPTLTVCCIG